jgi:hypothetical protein
VLQHGLIHLANIIYLASYAVKDMRVLRWLTVLGIVLLIPYYLAWGLWEAAIWNGVFLGINLWRLRTHSQGRNNVSNERASEPQSDTIEPSETKPPMKRYLTRPATPAAIKLASLRPEAAK